MKWPRHRYVGPEVSRLLVSAGKDLRPRQEGVVDLEGSRSDCDDAANLQGRDSNVDEAQRTVEPLDVGVSCTHRKPERVRTASLGRRLGRSHQFMSDTLALKVRMNFDILQLWRVRAREIRVADRVLVEPGDQVVTVALIETGQAKVSRDGLDFGILESSNFQIVDGRHFVQPVTGLPPRDPF